MAHQYSSRVSPFQAKTGTPASAMAAAAWSWVEKMLQLAQRTCAPRATSVSISTAVWTVMWSEPVMRAPARGCSPAYSSRRAMRPGISTSARLISRRPNGARICRRPGRWGVGGARASAGAELGARFGRGNLWSWHRGSFVGTVGMPARGRAKKKRS